MIQNPDAVVASLNAMDVSFLLMESDTAHAHGGILQIWCAPAGAESDFLRKLHEQMSSYPVTSPPFNYRLARGRSRLSPAWAIAEDIDLDYHFRFSALPRPGGERELGVLISRLQAHRLDRSRPLWELHLIEGLEPAADGRERFAIYMKLHHCLMDGVSGVELMTRSWTENPDQLSMPPIWALRQQRLSAQHAEGTRPDRSADGKRLHRAKDTATGLYRALPRIFRAWAQPASDELTAPYTAPATRLNATVGPHRRFATQSLDLFRVKAVAKVAGGTINDVVLALCATSLRLYLKDFGGLPARPLIAAVPVALPRQDGKGGNFVANIMVSLATDLADPKQRLHAISQSSKASKSLMEAMTPQARMLYTSMVGIPLLGDMILGGGKHLRAFNLAISNLPGPKRRLYFNRAELQAIYPVSVISNGQAINITAMSYADGLHFGVVACRRALPSVQRIATQLRDALAELEQVLDAKA